MDELTGSFILPSITVLLKAVPGTALPFCFPAHEKKFLHITIFKAQTR